MASRKDFDRSTLRENFGWLVSRKEFDDYFRDDEVRLFLRFELVSSLVIDPHSLTRCSFRLDETQQKPQKTEASASVGDKGVCDSLMNWKKVSHWRSKSCTQKIASKLTLRSSIFMNQLFGNSSVVITSKLATILWKVFAFKFFLV